MVLRCPNFVEQPVDQNQTFKTSNQALEQRSVRLRPKKAAGNPAAGGNEWCF